MLSWPRDAPLEPASRFAHRVLTDGKKKGQNPLGNPRSSRAKLWEKEAMSPRRQFTSDSPDRPYVTATMAIFLLICSIAAPEGCGPKPTTQPADPPAVSEPTRPTAPDAKPNDEGVDLSRIPGRIHFVQQGDTLYSLAERYYGHSKYWRKIATANRTRLNNPNDLPVGMKLIIPP
jgi:phage tail protein X